MNKKSILVVDDDSFNLQIIADILMKTELYSVMSATGGKMACELAQKFLPNLILMDWKMPGFSGYEAVQQLKTNDNTKKIPVIIITGVTDQEEISKAMNIGIAAYVTKPIAEKELLAKINTVWQ